jgi:hypothetical protein
MKIRIFFQSLCVFCLLFSEAGLADTTCSRDRQCDDGFVCNGMERCNPLSPAADSFGCLPTNLPETIPCSTPPHTVCDEADRVCIHEFCRDPDKDGDGHGHIFCGGDDCDDYDRDRRPGGFEVCDPEGHDEDCDPTTPGSRDADGDGYIDSECFNVRVRPIESGPSGVPYSIPIE